MHRKLVKAAAGTAAIVTTALGPAAHAAPARPAFNVGVACNEAALAAAITHSHHGEILILSPGCVYRLADSLPDITEGITIEGNGATLEPTRGASDFSLLTIDSGRRDVTILHLNFRRGKGYEGYYGGGVYAGSGDITLAHDVFKDNYVGEYGGAIYVSSAHVEVDDSVFDGNTSDEEYGGAIYNSGGRLEVSGSEFSHNSTDDGGAIYNDNYATLSNDTFHGNTAEYGGAVENAHRMVIRDSRLTGNAATDDGGAIYNNNCAELEIDGSDVTGNHAGNDGGGIYDDNGPTRVERHQTEIFGNTPNNFAYDSSASCGV